MRDITFRQSRNVRGELDPASLLQLGITPGQAEVLVLVAMGKTNKEIGVMLGISALTVKKHMENILRFLAVETRTAAAAVAMEAARFNGVSGREPAAILKRSVSA